jgi:glycosyltransferase involved in cell wall biosynthesis
MAGGAPVIAIRQHGPAETVREGETGFFFDEQTPASIVAAVRRFEREAVRFDNKAIRRYAQTFDRELFCRRFGEYVAERWEEHYAKKGRVLVGQLPGIKMPVQKIVD